MRDGFSYTRDRLFRHFWIDWQRQDTGLVEVSGWKVFRNVAEIGVDGIEWQRLRSSAMLRQLDYLHRAVIRFLKETADGLNCVSNHLFRHFGKDRQR